MKKHIDDDDKLTRQFTDSGQGRSMYVINESGVYALVFGNPRQGISSHVDDDDRGVQNMDTQGAFHHISHEYSEVSA